MNGVSIDICHHVCQPVQAKRQERTRGTGILQARHPPATSRVGAKVRHRKAWGFAQEKLSKITLLMLSPPLLGLRVSPSAPPVCLLAPLFVTPTADTAKPTKTPPPPPPPMTTITTTDGNGNGQRRNDGTRARAYGRGRGLCERRSSLVRRIPSTRRGCPASPTWWPWCRPSRRTPSSSASPSAARCSGAWAARPTRLTSCSRTPGRSSSWRRVRDKYQVVSIWCCRCDRMVCTHRPWSRRRRVFGCV